MDVRYWISDKKEFFFVFFAYCFLGLLYFSKTFSHRLLIDPEDSFLYYYPLRLYYADHFLRHGLHLWLPYEFLGLPFLGTLQTGLLYPINWTYFLLPAPYAFNLNLIFHYVLAAFFSFLYLKELGSKTFPSFFSGIVFGFSSFLIAQQNHISIIDTAIWLPLLLYFYEKIRNTLDWKYAVWASFAVALQACAGQFQMAIYSYLVLGLFVIFYMKSIPKGRLKIFIFLCLLPILLGSLIALPQLIATKELANHAWRSDNGYDFFTGYSFHPLMLPLLVYPFLFGGGYSSTAYWGAWNLPEMAGCFVGSLPLVMALWCLVKIWKENIHAKFWGIVLAVGLFLTLGGYNPLYHLMYYIPVYNLFRVSARNLFEFDFAVAILFAIGVDSLFSAEEKEMKKGILSITKGLGIVLLAGFAFFAFGWLVVRFPAQNIKVASISLPTDITGTFKIGNPAFWVPMIFIAAYLLALSGYRRIIHLRNHFLLLLAMLVFAEGYSFGQFQQASWDQINSIEQLTQNRLFDFLKTNANPLRTLFINIGPFPLYSVAAEISTLNGYDPLILNSFNQITGIDYYATSPPQWHQLLGNNRLLSAMNVKYIVVANEKASLRFFEDNIKGTPNSGKPAYRKILTVSNVAVFENTNCFSKVFSVTKLQPVDGTQNIAKKWYDPTFDPAKEAMVSNKDFSAIGTADFSPCAADLKRYDTDSISVRTSCNGTGFVVLADQYYPGWKASVDGKETPLYRVNGLFRGASVPAGDHLVVFQYVPREIYASAFIGGIVLIACIGALCYDAIK